MEKLPKCTKCDSEFVYEDGHFYICPECAYEWAKEEGDQVKEKVVKDAFGNILQDGDSVTVVKDLKVKGTSLVVKVGTKVKNIRLVEEQNGHDIDCKIKGMGPMMLKSSVVKKSNE